MEEERCKAEENAKILDQEKQKAEENAMEMEMELWTLRAKEILYKRKISILNKKLEQERCGHSVDCKVVGEELEAKDKKPSPAPATVQCSLDERPDIPPEQNTEATAIDITHPLLGEH